MFTLTYPIRTPEVLVLDIWLIEWQEHHIYIAILIVVVVVVDIYIVHKKQKDSGNIKIYELYKLQETKHIFLIRSVVHK